MFTCKKVDKIRALKSFAGEFTRGREYVVSAASEHSVSVELDDKGSTTNGWAKDCFELVQPEPKWVPKVGDRVRFTNEVPDYWFFGPMSSNKEGVVTDVGDETSALYITVDVGKDGTGFVGLEHIGPAHTTIPTPTFAIGTKVRMTQDVPPFAKKGDEGVVVGGPDVDGHLRVEYATGGVAGEVHFAEPGQLEAVAGLRIEAGKFYKTRDGRKVGPMVAYEGFLVGSGLHYASDGECCYHGKSNRRSFPKSDLIAEWADEPAATAEAATPKFKVGDAIRHKELGYVGFVKEVRPDGAVKTFWTKQGWGGTDRADEIELITAAPAPTTPAIVALITNGTPLPSASPKVHASQEAAGTEAARLAEEHKGQKFGVFVLADTKEVAKTYEHEWQRLAAGGDKILAIKAIRALTGFGLKASKDGIEDWLDRYVRRAA
jgi:ribosomal protein L7/L12